MRDTTTDSPDLAVRCPRGCPASGRVNLLTSMTRYYVCESCDARWNIARVDAGQLRGLFAGDAIR